MRSFYPSMRTPKVPLVGMDQVCVLHSFNSPSCFEAPKSVPLLESRFSVYLESTLFNHSLGDPSCAAKVKRQVSATSAWVKVTENRKQAQVAEVA